MPMGTDAPGTRRRARRVMFGVDGLILVLGLAFALVAITADPIQIRMAVQSLILLGLGDGGLAFNARGGRSAGCGIGAGSARDSLRA